MRPDRGPRQSLPRIPSCVAPSLDLIPDIEPVETREGGDEADAERGVRPERDPENDGCQRHELDQADENSDPSEQEMDDESRDEKQDALEQWLRRVPDDPGGLLRRKFRYESNQRRRRGDYQYRQTEKIW